MTHLPDTLLTLSVSQLLLLSLLLSSFSGSVTGVTDCPACELTALESDPIPVAMSLAWQVGLEEDLLAEPVGGASASLSRPR